MFSSLLYWKWVKIWTVRPVYWVHCRYTAAVWNRRARARYDANAARKKDKRWHGTIMHDCSVQEIIGSAVCTAACSIAMCRIHARPTTLGIWCAYGTSKTCCHVFVVLICCTKTDEPWSTGIQPARSFAEKYSIGLLKKEYASPSLSWGLQLRFSDSFPVVVEWLGPGVGMQYQYNWFTYILQNMAKGRFVRIGR